MSPPLPASKLQRHPDGVPTEVKLPPPSTYTPTYTPSTYATSTYLSPTRRAYSPRGAFGSEAGGGTRGALRSSNVHELYVASTRGKAIASHAERRVGAAESMDGGGGALLDEHAELTSLVRRHGLRPATSLISWFNS